MRPVEADSFDSFPCPILMYFEVEEKETEKKADHFLDNLGTVLLVTWTL